jgi:hypothetical protein
MKLINGNPNPTSDFRIRTPMVTLQPNPTSKSKSFKNKIIRIKPKQTALERLKQTDRTKRNSKNTKEISQTR